MSKDLPAIPRTRRPAADLESWIDEESRSPAPAAASVPPRRKQVRIHAEVDPDLRRRLKRAALELDTTVSDLLREWAEAGLKEKGF